MKAYQAIGLSIAMLLFCPLFLKAEVYTIDFNRGTVSGSDSYYTSLPSNNAAAFCSSGAGNISEYSKSNCYYQSKSKGCGIRIGQATSTGQAYVIFTLSSEIQSKYIVKIIVYASRGTQSEDASLKIYAGSITETETIGFADMLDYDSSRPASTDYRLPDVILGKKFKQLKVQAQNTNYVMLHRIDIYTAEEESLSLPAQSGSTYYATFSSDKATFFPEDEATVSKVSVSGGLLNVTALASQDGFGTTGYYVPANTGVLVASASSGATYYTLEGETLDALDDNMLKPASETMTGDNKFYKLAYDDYDNKTGLGFYWGAEAGGAFSCKEGTAYLAVPNGGGSVKGFVLDEASDGDAIESLTPDPSSRRGEIYNVAGQRISTPSQGFYIKDGRKFVGK